MADISPELLKLLDGDREYVDPSKDPRQMRQIAGTMPLLAPQNPANQGPQLQLYQPPNMNGTASDALSQYLSERQNSPEKQAFIKANQDLSTQQMADADKSQELLKKLLSGENGKWNLQPLMALSDAWTGTELMKGYKPPMTDDDKLAKAAAIENQIASQRGDAAKTKISALKALSDSKDTMAALRMQMTQGRTDNKRWQQLDDALNPMKGRAGEFGRQAQFVNNAKRVMALGAQYPDGNIPNSQFGELATSTAGLVGAGSQVAEGIVKRYMPDTAASDSAGIQQWLTNTATPVQRASFVSQILDTAKREHDLAAGNIKKTQISNTAGFLDLMSPENQNRFELAVKMKGLDPQDIYKGLQSGTPSDYLGIPDNINPEKVGVNAVGGQGGGGKVPVRTQVSPSTGKKKITYSDGSEEIQ